MSSIAGEHALAKINELAYSVHEHKALRNSFYELWMTQRLNQGQVELFAKNFYEHVAPTVDRIALTFLRLGDLEARTETIENMFDEMGNGDPQRAHTLILKDYFGSLLSAVSGGKMTYDDVTAPVVPSTTRLVERGRELFGSEHAAESCGALLAQEWHAYPQLVNLYEGARNYMDQYPDLESFHESCEFFYLHIGSAEKEHKIHSLSSAARICDTQEKLDLLERGFNSYLDELALYWDGLHEALVAMG